MVGIVIVAHSNKLAEGVRDLAQQMVQGKAAIAIAAGTDDPANPLGTDASKIFQAIDSVYSDDGVVVLMDLGSAILSAETALDFFPDHQKENIYLCEAPLVEGVLSAAVQATGGGNIESVIEEARNALNAKTSQLGIDTTLKDAEQEVHGPADSTQEIVLPVRNKLGLHARPAAQFVSTASKFKAEIFVKNLSKNTDFVNAKSINQIITLGVRHGHQIMIAAAGSDASDAILSLNKLIDSNFNEEENASILTPLSQKDKGVRESKQNRNVLEGIPVSSGIAIGNAFIYRPVIPDVQEYGITDIEIEITRFRNALDEVKKDIETLQRETKKSMDAYDASIFESHLLYLNDPALVDHTRDIITEQLINAEAAWETALKEMINSYKSIGDQIVRDREVDLIDIGSQVMSKLTGKPRTHPDPDEPSILIAQELNPSETAQLNPEKILALCAEKGNKTSHSAIVARSFGIPAVFGIGERLLEIEETTTLIVDGNEGIVIVEPDNDTLKTYRKHQETDTAAKQKAVTRTLDKAVSVDGTVVGIMANVSYTSDIKYALEHGAEGVGLFRTEFLYMNRTTLPSEEDQYKVYKEAADLLGNRPLTIRTVDIGGDKPVPYLNIIKEPNPYLGWRGLRYCLDQIDVFKTQLRAILRAAYDRNVLLMFPMVTTVREMRAASAIINEVKQELSQDGYTFNDTIKIGAMIETPSAVMMAHRLINEVDFFSIGSNDLTQYVLAADRTNSKVATLGDPFDPAVLKMIHDTIVVAHNAGKRIGLCGEMAGDRLALPLLLGFGLDEFSMSPKLISEWKEALRSISAIKAKELAREALQCIAADDVKHLCSEFLKDI